MTELGERWVEGWRKAIAAAKSRGFGACFLEIDGPASISEVEEVERKIGRILPAQFRRTLLEFSRRVNFYWYLGKCDKPPGLMRNVFCGGCQWDIGRLAGMYEEVEWLSANAFIEDTPDETIWREKLPFHDIASGDFIAIDVSSDNEQPVVYLSHELCYSHGYVLGADFFDFMDRWTAIGCPDDDIWPLFVPEKESFIDLGCANVLAWCEWFGLPPARAKFS